MRFSLSTQVMGHHYDGLAEFVNLVVYQLQGLF
jgi:hypothetical protein